MRHADRQSRLWDCLWFLAWGVLSSIWCLSAAGRLGATFDEPLYVAKGLERWQTGSRAGLLELGVMPGAVEVTTLPLYLSERCRGIEFDPRADLGELLPWARAGTLLFWWLLLACGLKAGRHIGGPWGGRLAVAFLATEPSLLAHASLATTDVALTACLLALCYHFRASRQTSWLRRVAVPMLWFAAALLMKASALVFGPLCLIAVELQYLIRELHPAHAVNAPKNGISAGRAKLRAELRSFARDAGWVLAGGLLLAWLYDRGTAVALLAQILHNTGGHPGGAYLLGESRPGGFWYYFPVALTIKLSLAMLLLPFVLALLKPTTLLNWACVAAVVLLLFSPCFRVQIGIRLVLPLVCLLAVGASAAVPLAWQQSPQTWKRVLLVGSTVGALLWALWTAVAVWPQGLCYANELWGGTADGYRRLSDSNYDWGQGLKELAAWQKQQHIVHLDVWYFGTDPALKSLPMREAELQKLTSPEEVAQCLHGRYLAVGTTILYGSYFGDCEAARFLRARQPLARTTTFLIYDFTADSAGNPGRQSTPRLALDR